MRQMEEGITNFGVFILSDGVIQSGIYGSQGMVPCHISGFR